MIQEISFIRGNQKSYIRVACALGVEKSYEYQMCTYNTLSSLLPFHQRSQDGVQYLYYEVSGMQSLDVCLQTQKLKRAVMISLVKAVIKLCRELSEYALNLGSIVFGPKYIMLSSNEEEIQFLYTFGSTGEAYEQLEQLLEFCIEYLDYQDDLLVDELYKVYERLLEQKELFYLAGEMERLLTVLSGDCGQDPSETATIPFESLKQQEALDPFSEGEAVMISQDTSSEVAGKEFRNLKYGLFVLLLLDVGCLLFWKPITFLKIFFCIAAGGVLLVLNIHVRRQEKQHEKERELQQKSKYIEEYETLSNSSIQEDGGTQIISIESNEGVLYNLQESEPQYIYIGDTRKVIGKDPKKAQVLLQQAGVSRIHAMIVKEGRECILEDLNSTNGTWVNEKCLEPRTRYVLKQGDKVRFAGMEYIFR
ncbi:MAG: FHA domain-containing protein [Lachnospiraceae bacterium]|nr:FHA domain-containing protein [Lachnospiraceae bacterium]